MSNRSIPAAALAAIATLAACAIAGGGPTTYRCESGGTFVVTWTDESARFVYGGDEHALPATGRAGEYAAGDMVLRRGDGDVSLRVLDEVVVWGCREAPDDAARAL